MKILQYTSWMSCRKSASGNGAVIVCSFVGGIPTVTYKIINLLKS